MKKTILVAAVFLILGFTPHVFAQGFVPLTNIPGLTDSTSVNATLQNGFATFLNNLYKYLIGLAAILAVIEIIWGGLEISTKDSVSKNKDGKERIQQALFGLVLVLSPVLVFTIINPSILNLSLNLPPIQPSAGYSGGAVTTTIDPTTQCSVTGISGIAQVATCPTLPAATMWGQKCAAPGIVIGPVVTANNASTGQPATTKIVCVQRNKFEFVDTKGFGSWSSVIRLQPLAITSNLPINGSNTTYSTNGSDAVQFSLICPVLGQKTCLSTSPTFSLGASHICAPPLTGTLPVGAPAPAQCYTETLTCQDVSFVQNDTCSSNPGWTPVQ